MPVEASARSPASELIDAPGPRDHGYLSEPEAIYARSFAIIDAETDWSGVPDELRPVVRRVVHACGMTDIVADLAWSSDLFGRATAALGAGAPVVCDAGMVAGGVMRHALPADNAVVCALDRRREAPPPGTTRAAAAIADLGDTLDGAVVAIGNAPTALFRLLELAGAGRVAPAAVIAMPVGFVGAAESKAALADAPPCPFFTLHGRRGGSAMAAAAVNALALAAGRR